uniref:Chromo domain-containing protein n=1 Tax=Ananas comosus var. bracteatus TaxID=296719 RepID=A0A6V7Q0P4_ANACO|nr:unnamed protein product [Ananas comosus var. bracteatus]
MVNPSKSFRLSRTCFVPVLDYGEEWFKYLPLVEFTYSNSYQASIEMASYEALYGRRCRSPIDWDDVGERPLIGPDLLEDAKAKIRLAREQLLTAQSRQRSYVDQRWLDLEFPVGKHVLLKIPDLSYVTSLTTIQLREDLSYDEALLQIMPCEVKLLHNPSIPYVKVLWENHEEREATWELKSIMRKQYPQFFRGAE